MRLLTYLYMTWWRIKTWFQVRILKRAYVYAPYRVTLRKPVVDLSDYDPEVIKRYAEKPLNPLFFEEKRLDK